MFGWSRLKRIALLAVLMSCCHGAAAWDGQNQGTVGLIEIAEAGNYGIRIWLANQTSMCGPNSPAWVYFEETDGNYRSNMAVLLMAKAQQLQVVVYGELDAGGHCRLGHLSVI